MKLTQNFSTYEFDCKDGSDMPDEVLHNVIKLSAQLQVLRSHINKPIKINSAYRSVEYNKSIGGVSNSQHILGKAADIVVDGISPFKLADIINDLINKGEMLQGGIGIYNTFVHYDIRKTRARWDNRK